MIGIIYMSQKVFLIKDKIIYLYLELYTKKEWNRKKCKKWGYTMDNFSNKEFKTTKIKNSSISFISAFRYAL